MGADAAADGDTGTDGPAEIGVRRATTIAVVAREAGVSVPTVSKVLNGRADVAAGTRARVEDVLERQGYRRRRSVRSSGPRLIDLAVHGMHSGWATEIIRGVEEVAGPERAAVVLSDLGSEHRVQREWFDDLLTRRPLGVILVLAELDDEQRRVLATRDIPFVVVDTAGEPPDGVPVVGSTNWAGGLAATRHLLAQGHRRIGIVTGPRDMTCSRARLDGYRSALDEAGLPVDPTLVRYGDFDVKGGFAHGRDLLARAGRPTAVFAGSDLQALGLIRAARDLDLSVPGDVSVVGYDDIPVAAWTTPALTTVRQPLRAMARTAAQMVFDLTRGDHRGNRRIDLATDLIVRESTAPPNS